MSESLLGTGISQTKGKAVEQAESVQTPLLMRMQSCWTGLLTGNTEMRVPSIALYGEVGADRNAPIHLSIVPVKLATKLFSVDVVGRAR
jgi:hypothetical protein